jgi:hypothetical protein
VANDSDGIVADVRTTIDMVKRYARQQTLDPLRGLGRYVGFGLLGSFLLAIGILLLGMSALRALQFETGDVFDGGWSWVPYVIVAVAMAIVIAIAVALISRDPRRSS